MRIFKTLIAVCILFQTQTGTAQDQRIEGIIQAVDPESSTLKLQTSDGKQTDYDVLKKARITVDDQPATLKDVRRGQSARIVFKSDLEVVTEIVATGDGLPEPEISVLKELPDPQALHGAPWLSDDGLTLYWQSTPPGEKQRWIWTAHRQTPDDLFSDFQKLVPGMDPTVRSDGLELILFDQLTLLSSTRTKPEGPFRRPQKIAELAKHGVLAAPCLSGDGLTLYSDVLGKDGGRILKFQRRTRTSKWGPPDVLKFSGIANLHHRFIQVSADQKTAFTSYSLPDKEGKPVEPLIVMWTADASGTYADPRQFVVAGEALHGKFPRYVAQTGELFFARWRQDPPGPDELVLVRNFDPAAHSQPLNAALSP